MDDAIEIMKKEVETREAIIDTYCTDLLSVKEIAEKFGVTEDYAQTVILEFLDETEAISHMGEMDRIAQEEAWEAQQKEERRIRESEKRQRQIDYAYELINSDDINDQEMGNNMLDAICYYNIY